MAYIYKIYNDINMKIYIGKTKDTIEARFKQHIKASKGNNKKGIMLYAAMRKYGVENFHIELVEECSEDMLNEREIYWISVFDCCILDGPDKGYNMTRGGDGGATLSTDAHRRVNGEPIQQYDLNGNFIAEYVSSGEAAEFTHTTQTEINRCCNMARNAYSANGFIWKRKNDFTPVDVWVAANKTKNNRKAVEQYSLDGKLIQTYESIAEAGRTTGVDNSQINECCNKRRKSAHDYIWKFVHDPTPIEELIKIQNPNANKPRPVEQYDLKGNLIAIFPSIAEAARKCAPNHNTSCISDVCNGTQKTAYGYIWRFSNKTYKEGVANE